MHPPVKFKIQIDGVKIWLLAEIYGRCATSMFIGHLT